MFARDWKKVRATHKEGNSSQRSSYKVMGSKDLSPIILDFRNTSEFKDINRESLLSSDTSQGFDEMEHLLLEELKQNLQIRDKREEVRKEIIIELIDTERHYVTSLKTLCEEIVQPLLDNKILNAEEVREIFALHYAQVLLRLHQSLLTDIEKLQKTYSRVTSCIGKLFLSYTQSFKMYSNYINEYPKSLQAVNRLKIENNKFSEHLQKTKKKGSLDIYDYMIMPVQRPSRYELLLTEIQKNTGDIHPDYKSIGLAVKQIKQVNDFINEEKQRFESTSKWLSLDLQVPPDAKANIFEIRKDGKLNIATKPDVLFLYFIFQSLFILVREDKAFLGFMTSYKIEQYHTLDAIRIQSIQTDTKPPTFDLVTPINRIRVVSENPKKQEVWINEFRQFQKDMPSAGEGQRQFRPKDDYRESDIDFGIKVNGMPSVIDDYETGPKEKPKSDNSVIKSRRGENSPRTKEPIQNLFQEQVDPSQETTAKNLEETEFTPVAEKKEAQLEVLKQSLQGNASPRTRLQGLIGNPSKLESMLDTLSSSTKPSGIIPDFPELQAPMSISSELTESIDETSSVDQNTFPEDETSLQYLIEETYHNINHQKKMDRDKTQTRQIFKNKFNLGKNRMNEKGTVALYRTLANFYQIRGRSDDYKKALDMYEKALEIDSEFQNEKDLGLHLAEKARFIHARLNRHKEAEDIYEKAILVQEKAWGKTSIQVAQTKFEYAGLLNRHSRFVEALETYNNLLDICQQSETLSKDSVRIGEIYTSIGNVHWNQKNWEEAYTHHQKSLQYLMAHKKEEKIPVAEALLNLAFMYEANNRGLQALEFHNKVLSIYVEVYGEYAIKTADIWINIANLNTLLKRYDQAEEEYKKALTAYQKQKKEKDPRIADIYNFLGHLYRLNGNPQKAEEHLLKALELYQQSVGKRHSLVGELSNDIGKIFIDQNKFKEGEILIQESLDIRRECLGESHSKVASNFFDLAQLYQRQNQFPQAEENYKRAIRAYKAQMTYSDASAMTYKCFAELYFDQKKYHDAEIHFREALNIYKKLEQFELTASIEELSQPDVIEKKNTRKKITGDVMCKLSQVLLKQDLRKVSGEYLLQAMEFYKEANSTTELAQVYKDLGNLFPKDAEYYLTEAIKTKKAEKGEKHIETANTLIDLGKFYYHSNDLQKALQLLQAGQKLLQKPTQEVQNLIEELDRKGVSGSEEFSWAEYE